MFRHGRAHALRHCRIDTPETPFADAIVLAAGSSERMVVDKLMLEVAGLPLLAWTLKAVAAAETVRRVVLVGHEAKLASLADQPWVRAIDPKLVVGGQRRQESVADGFAATDSEVVLIHDGARPLVTPDLVDRVARAAREKGAAVPIAPVPESMRRVVDGEIVAILDRHGLFRSQTPHGARREVLASVYEQVDPYGDQEFIDETTYVQSTGFTVCTVPGEQANLKVTLPGDEKLAFGLLEARARSRADYPWLDSDVAS